MLHGIQARIGWISPGALNYASVRLDVAPAEVHGVASFYGMFSLRPRPPVVAHVCDDIGCLIRGAEALCAELERTLGPEGSPQRLAARPGFAARVWVWCERAPRGFSTARRAKRRRKPYSLRRSRKLSKLWCAMP